MLYPIRFINSRTRVGRLMLIWVLLCQSLIAFAQTFSVSLNTHYPVMVDSVVELSAQVSGETNALQYQWDFGDGSHSGEYSPDSTMTHTYQKPGRFTVVVSVKDATGVEKTASYSQAVYTQATAQKPTKTSSIVFDTTHQRVWNVNPDNDTVTVIDAKTNTKLREIRVGKQPRTLAISPSGLVAVVNQRSHSISIINATDMQVVHTVTLPFASQPFGILFDRNGAFAYVTLAATGNLLKISAANGEVVGSLELGGNPRHMAMTGEGSKLYVTRYITAPVTDEHTAAPNPQTGEGGEISIVSTETFRLSGQTYLQADQRFDTPASSRGIPNYLGAPVISPDGQSAWVPSKEDNIFRGVLRDGQALNFEHTLRAVTSKLDLGSDQEIFNQRIDHNDAGLATAGVFGPNGNYLFVALETSREVAVMDAYSGFQLFRFFAGFAPQGLALSDDGQHLYVHNFMSRSVMAYDLTLLLQTGAQNVRRVAEVTTVANEQLKPQVLLGKQLFYDALDNRLARDDYMSCATCHQDEGHDGRVWDMTGFGEGLRNTIALTGRAGLGHGLLHWSANFDEVQDFEGQIRTLSEGTGLMSDSDFNQGTRNQPLGDTKAGLSADLDAMAAFLGSLNTFQPSPYRLDSETISNTASGGRSVFITHCATCHGGINFTKSSTVDVLENIGSISASSGSRLGQSLTALDVPTMRDVWDTAPYLHDGSAGTLKEAVEAHDGLSLDSQSLEQVIAYIRELGSGEPNGVFAENDGMPKVVLNQPQSDSNNVSGSIEAVANDSDGAIAKVEFYYNLLLIETVTEPPYVFTWENVPNGSYPIVAKAHDNAGNVSSSNAVTILVDNQGNQAPIVTLQAPQGVTGLTSGSIEANANDPDGAIQRVEFYYNGDLIGTFENAPYILRWQGIPAGEYELIAKAYDNAGAVAISEPVVVQVISTQ